MLTDALKRTLRVVLAGVVATYFEKVQAPVVTGLKFSHSLVADA